MHPFDGFSRQIVGYNRTLFKVTVNIPSIQRVGIDYTDPNLIEIMDFISNQTIEWNWEWESSSTTFGFVDENSAIWFKVRFG